MLVHILLFSVAALAASVSSTPSLRVEVTGPATVTSAKDLKITTIVTNTGDTPLTLLDKPNLKSSLTGAFSADTFHVVDSSGATVESNGIVAKNAAISTNSKETLTVLDPGQSLEVEHNLFDAYSFTEEGEYIVVPNNLFYIVNSKEQVVPVEAATGPYIVNLRGNVSSWHPSHPTYVDCTADQQDTLNNVVRISVGYAWDAYSFLRNNPGPTPRYTTWFGAYDSDRYNTVKENYQLISHDPNFQSFTYNCSCTNPTSWGYVIPGEFGIVYLCPTFWTLPDSGKDSKAGSLVQKSSHFTRNGGALDHAWSQPLCKKLAVTDPTKAIHNADTYEYFAENDPAL